VSGDDEGRQPFSHEEETVDRITFLVNVLILTDELRFQPRADPCQKVLVSNYLEQVEFGKDDFVDLHKNLHFEMDWQCFNETLKAAHVLLVVVLEGFVDFEVQVVRDAVRCAKLVQEKKLFLQCSLRRIIVGDDRGQGARHERERGDSDELQKHAEDALRVRVSRNVAVAHGGDGRNDEVAGHDVLLSGWKLLNFRV